MSLQSVDGRLFAMYVERLPASLKRGTVCNLGPEDARTIFSNITSALDYLESQHVIHNDIKPANIAYPTQRGAVLLDFGLAARSDESVSSGGTPWYIPPEYATHNFRRTPGDMWALGATMLYIVRKSKLPERIGPNWYIRDVRPNVTVRETMMSWVKQVAHLRDGLYRDEKVEAPVYRMLSQERERRIRSVEIVAELRSRAHEFEMGCEEPLS